MKIIDLILPEDSRFQTIVPENPGLENKVFSVMKSMLWVFVSIMLTKLLSELF